MAVKHKNKFCCALGVFPALFSSYSVIIINAKVRTVHVVYQT